METIEISDEYTNWVASKITSLFTNEDITITDNARRLIALSMQAQIQDELLPNKEELFERAERIASKDFVEYYKERHGKKTMNYNRAFHLLADWGIVLKFPWTTSLPPKTTT